MEKNSKPRVLPLFWPPFLVLRQAGSVLYYSVLIKWRKLPYWFLRSSVKTLKVAAGAYGMGCIGFPAHPVWEVTKKCNLRCIHCHVSSQAEVQDELNKEEGLNLIEEIASVKEFRMLVLTGGEPLIRKDIFELISYGKTLGLKFVIATNGTLIDEDTAFRLKESGVVGVAISLDSLVPEVHNFIRNNSSAYNLAIRGIKNSKKAGLVIQINFTATKLNLKDLEKTIEMVEDLGADILLIYQLVCVGRGRNISEFSLEKEENKKLVSIIANKQKNCSTIIEPVATPQYWSYILSKNKKLSFFFPKVFFHGCTAGRGLVYIKANGEVWPCPFIEVTAGNVRNKPFSKIWRESEIFVKLRARANLKGSCGSCEYKEVCGGCRGKAWALKGDYLDEDPSCFIHTEH